ncbi:biopolymer transporter ExbD [Thalassococcus sp. CAU 1522]|uniref:Biopolymer transporter ExbD n=1 Tax=Thalassococcus arenae TaxID=2851652 RepID=A0ABS6N919_9RHOB|nr:biopolymer transporter ExbD [Thalassococcus arenae]MBV2360500.1 biopolymer transporter ExbD [Thalassococcus arenae]
MVRARHSLPRAPRRGAEPVVPMINIVFLLLIFFLMTARIAPQAPFDVTLPRAAADPGENAAQPLYVSGDGALAFGAVNGAAAVAAAAAKGDVILHADARLPAVDLARILAELGRAGATGITLTTGGAP